MNLLLDALQFKNQNRPPVWLMRQAGRYMPSYLALRKKYSFLEICHQPDLITQVTRLPIDEFGFDAAILFSDILMVPEALGFHVRFEDNQGPIIDNKLTSERDIENFSTHDFEERLSFLPPAIKELKKYPVPLIGFTGAPFTLASYIIEGKTSRDLKNTKKWAYQNPKNFEKIIALLENAIIKSLKIQEEAGCDALQIFDSWAQVLNPEHFTKWCLEPLKRISAALNKPVIYFCKGSSYLAPQIAATGVTAISIDWLYPIEKLRKTLPKTPLQGNLDPHALYLPQDLLIQEVKTILNAMDKDPGFVFNLGHGILPDVPYENVRALVETVHAHQ